jgi:hypothetical protein
MPDEHTNAVPDELRDAHLDGIDFLDGVRKAQPLAQTALAIGFADPQLEFSDLVWSFAGHDQAAIERIATKDDESFDIVYDALRAQARAGLQIGIAIGLLLRPKILEGAK